MKTGAHKADQVKIVIMAESGEKAADISTKLGIELAVVKNFMPKATAVEASK